MGCRENSNIEKNDDIEKMFRIFDTNKDGSLELDEFIESMKFLGITKELVELDCLEIRDAFKLFDLNNDGKITLQEYLEGSKKMGNQTDPAKLTCVFRLFDYDKDGEITYKEFNWAIHYLASTAYDRDPNINSNINF